MCCFFDGADDAVKHKLKAGRRDLIDPRFDTTKSYSRIPGGAR